MTGSPVVPQFPSPTLPASSRRVVLLRHLDYFRAVVIAKVADLPDDQARASRLPSGWAPVELLRHLAFVELRWLEWGFEGSPVPDAWGDRRDDRWFVAADTPVATVVKELRERGERTRAIVLRHDLAEIGAPGERWEGAPPATLERVLLHLVQEYARHAGHVDVVRELIDGRTGE